VEEHELDPYVIGYGQFVNPVMNHRVPLNEGEFLD
jgi:hypothetical protein